MVPAVLVLWDIDHTLIESGGVGRQVYAAAFEKVTGRRLEHMAELSGRTEPMIFRETLQLHGIDDPGDLFDRFAEEQARGYAEHADELRTKGRVLPGAAEVLRILASRDDVIQSVLTGNIHQSAQIKLTTFGLDRYLDLDIGAYGTDDEVRAHLVEIARQRATAARGVYFDRDTTVLIGDTPNDIKAARDGGARVIAVATGKDSEEDLTKAGADTVFADLTDIDALLAAIHGDQ
jgi:phosphoglycolate phosphatase